MTHDMGRKRKRQYILGIVLARIIFFIIEKKEISLQKKGKDYIMRDTLRGKIGQNR